MDSWLDEDSPQRRLTRSLWPDLSLEQELAYAGVIKLRGAPTSEKTLALIELEVALARRAG